MFGWFRHRRQAKNLARILEAIDKRRSVRAKFDAAQTTDDNRKHWSNADNLSGQAWASPAVRQKLRSRARYEGFNNALARGIIETLANDTIGTGPRLQLTNVDTSLATAIESAFNKWADSINLAAKLRQMRRAKTIDGESFAVFTANPVRAKGIPLDLRVYEADQVATPFNVSAQNAVDGIVFDAFDNPKEYHVLRRHPGDADSFGAAAAQTILAENVIHYFAEDRPGQKRGLPEILASLPLFADLRRFTLAVIAAAETAADFAGVAQTRTSAEDSDASAATPYDTIELDKRMLTVLPDGYELGQLKAEQPATTYKEFKAEIINEIARPLNMPFNIAAANSASYNYSSGRMDHQTYFKALTVERDFIEKVILERVFSMWFSFAVLKSGYLPQEARSADFDTTHEWFWDGFEHVDPTKESQADEIDLRIGTTTLADIYAKKGQDWEAKIAQRGREIELMKRLGIPVGSPAPAPAGVANENENKVEDEDDVE